MLTSLLKFKLAPFQYSNEGLHNITNLIFDIFSFLSWLLCMWIEKSPLTSTIDLQHIKLGLFLNLLFLIWFNFRNYSFVLNSMNNIRNYFWIIIYICTCFFFSCNVFFWFFKSLKCIILELQCSSFNKLSITKCLVTVSLGLFHCSKISSLFKSNLEFISLTKTSFWHWFFIINF